MIIQMEDDATVDGAGVCEDGIIKMGRFWVVFRNHRICLQVGVEGKRQEEIREA